MSTPTSNPNNKGSFKNASERDYEEEQAILKKAGVYKLHDAARRNASEAAAVLIRQGANVHAKDDKGATPLHIAAEHDASSTAEVLLRAGADVHAKDNNGKTPLYYAEMFGRKRVDKLLRRYDARK